MENDLVSEEELKSFLEDKSERELIGYIMDLYRGSPLNQEALTLAVRGKSYGRTLLKEYEKRIQNVFNAKGWFSMEKAEQPLKEFKEVCAGKYPDLYTELQLYYAQHLAKIVGVYGYPYMEVEDSLNSNYKEVCKRVSSDYKLYKQLKDELIKVVKEAEKRNVGYEMELARYFDDIPWTKKEYPYGLYETNYYEDGDD